MTKESPLREGDLDELFRDYGEVTSSRIWIDFKTRKPCGFGFVEMKDDEDAEDAIKKLNGKLWRGKYLTVSKARRQR